MEQSEDGENGNLAPAEEDTPRRRGRPRKGPEVARHLPRDEELLHIAAQVFYQKGYEGTRLEDIAREAGIAKASLYHYFESKEQLYERLVGRTVALLDLFQATAEERGDADQRLARLLWRSVAVVATNPLEFGVINRNIMQMDGDAGNRARDQRKVFLDAVKRIVAEGQSDGTFRPSDAVVTAHLLLGSSISLSEWFRPWGRISVQEIQREHVTFLLAALGVPGHRIDELIGNLTRSDGESAGPVLEA